MERLERFYKIDRLLKERRSVSFEALQDALEVSPATLKRDLEYMRERFNAPIEWDRQSRGYVFGKPRTGQRYELPGLWFTAEEAYALLTMQSLLANLQPGLLEPHIKAMKERLAAVLGTGEYALKDIERRIRVLQPGRRESNTEHFGVVANALLRRHRLRLRHYNRIQDKETEREVSPQRLVHYRDNWYLDAWCHLREDLRSFSVDALREVQPVDTKARELAKDELDAYLKSGYGIFAGRDVQWAKLRFTPEAARWVSVQSWHSQQRASFDERGSYLLEIPYADDRELVMEVLKFGADVEVLGPQSLRKRVAESLKKAVERY